MKTVLAIIVSFVVVVIAAILVVPTFIDWNQYKSEIVDRALEATGRAIEIRGDIKLSVLPAPTLKVADVRVLNVEGAASADMAALKSLEVRVALMPLLGGNIQVESVRLVQPVIDIERFADGRTNLTFKKPGAATASAGGGKAGTSGVPAEGGGGPAIAVDNFVIEKGTVIFRDDAAGRIERIEDLNGRFAAASLAGPIESSGSLVARGIPLSYKLAVGTIVNSRTAPFSAELNLTPGDVKVQISGTLAGIGEAPRFKGKLNIEGRDLARIAAAAGAGLPAPLARPFGAAATINASAESADIGDLRLSVGDTRGEGKISVKLGDTVEADVSLNVNRLDVAELLTAPKQAPAAKPATSSGDGKSASAPLAPASKPAAKDASGGAVEIPKNVAAQINLQIGAISYRDHLIRNAKLDAALNAGEITVNQVSAQLPGASDVALFGFVTLPGGKPQFDGNMDFSTNDLRAVLSWLGIEAPPAAPERLRKLAFAGKIAADASQLRLDEIDVGFDGTRVKGAVTVALRERPAFGANLLVDKINLDAYLPAAESKPKSAAKGKAAADKSAAGTAPKPAANPNPHLNPLAPLAALGGFDANLKARIGALTFSGVPVKDVRIDASLYNGALTLKEVRVADAAGVSAKLAGAITGLAAPAATADPKLAGMTVDVRAKSLSRIAKLAEITLPVSPEALGAVSLAGRLDGAPADLAVDLTANAARGSYRVKGRLRPLDPLRAVDADVTLRHPDLRRLLSALGTDYAPAGRLGKLDLTGRLTGGLGGFSLTGLKGTAADVQLAGDVKAALGGAKPQVTVNLDTGPVSLERFLPAQRKAALDGESRVRKAMLRLPPGVSPADYLVAQLRRVATGSERWSRDPIDLSALNSLNAEVSLKSSALAYEKYRLEGADLSASLKDGVLTANRLTGRVFGGKLSAGGRVAATGKAAHYETQLSVSDVNLAQAMSALGSSAIKAGRMSFGAELTTAGASVFDMVSGLNGQGKASLAGIDPGASGQGSMLGAFTGLLQPLNALGGRKQGSGLADASATFRVQNGVASFNDLKIASGVGNGFATGTVDLANWRVDAKGTIRLDQNILVALLAQKTKTPQTLPFTVSGRLDLPNVKLETGKLQGGGLAIPGLGKLEKKAPGVGKVLDQLLPGVLGGQPQQQQAPAQQQSSEPTPQQPTPQQPAPQKKKTEPVDQLIKGILKGLGR